MMMPVECEYEAPLLAAVLEGRWPLGVEADLREHAAHCSICSEVIALSEAFALAHSETRVDATVPDASRVWWMAQIRARREAAEEAVRPILATQLAACAWVVGLLIVCLGVALSWFQTTRVWIESAATLLLAHGVVLSLAAAVVVILPTAAYFAMGKE